MLFNSRTAADVSPPRVWAKCLAQRQSPCLLHRRRSIAEKALRVFGLPTSVTSNAAGAVQHEHRFYPVELSAVASRRCGIVRRTVPLLFMRARLRSYGS